MRLIDTLARNSKHVGDFESGHGREPGKALAQLHNPAHRWTHLRKAILAEDGVLESAPFLHAASSFSMGSVSGTRFRHRLCVVTTPYLSASQKWSFCLIGASCPLAVAFGSQA